jgi:hypothetical protein
MVFEYQIEREITQPKITSVSLESASYSAFFGYILVPVVETIGSMDEMLQEWINGQSEKGLFGPVLLGNLSR